MSIGLILLLQKIKLFVIYKFVKMRFYDREKGVSK